MWESTVVECVRTMTKESLMNRIFASALVLGAISSFGLVGCADKAAEESKTTITTPTGTTTATDKHEVKTTEPGGVPAAPVK